MKQAKLLTALIALFLCTSHGCMQTENDNTSMVYRYGDILDIRYTPNNDYRCGGWFVDRGSWMGFTLPDEELWVNGVCGPFNLESRRWLSPALVTAGFAGSEDEVFVPDSVNYFPGELFLSATSPTGNITQRMIFLDRNTALLKCVARDTDKAIRMHGTTYADNTCEVNENSCLLALASGEQLKLSFEEDVKISRHDGGYEAIVPEGRHQTWVVLSFCSNHKEHLNNENFIGQVLARPTHFVDEHHRLWENSLRKVLRTDMPREYDRVAVKAVMTLMSNWKSSRGGLLHEGVVPSHAVGYFMGFWAWDSWKHAVALSAFIPELAKNQVRP